MMLDQPRGGHVFNIDGAGSDGRPTPRFYIMQFLLAFYIYSWIEFLGFCDYVQPYFVWVGTVIDLPQVGNTEFT